MQTFNLNLSFSYEEVVASTVILITTIAFIWYWFLAQSEAIKNRFYRADEFDVASRKHIFFTKYMGFLILGVFPLVLVMGLFGTTLADVGLTWYAKTTWFSFFWIAALSIAVIPLAYRSAKKPENLVWLNTHLMFLVVLPATIGATAMNVTSIQNTRNLLAGQVTK